MPEGKFFVIPDDVENFFVGGRNAFPTWVASKFQDSLLESVMQGFAVLN